MSFCLLTTGFQNRYTLTRYAPKGSRRKAAITYYYCGLIKIKYLLACLRIRVILNVEIEKMKNKTSFDKFLDWGYGFGEVMVFAFVLTPLTMCFIVGTLMLVGGAVQYINQ